MTGESSSVRDHLANDAPSSPGSAPAPTWSWSGSRWRGSPTAAACHRVQPGRGWAADPDRRGRRGLRHRSATGARPPPSTAGDAEGISSASGPAWRRPCCWWRCSSRRSCCWPAPDRAWDDGCRMQPSPTSRLRGSREITFAVLAVAASSFALLQSLIVPVLATIQVAVPHLADDGHLGADGVPALRVDLHAAARAGSATWSARSGCWCSRLVALVPRLPGRGARAEHRLADRRLGSLQGVGGGVLPLSFGIIRDEFPASG